MRLLNARSASGANTTVSAIDQITVAATGCCSDHGASGRRGTLLPQSTRMDCTSDDTGFHSAIARSHDAIPSVGTNALDRNVIGNIVANMNPLTASIDCMAQPTRMPNQIIAKPNRSRTAKPSTASTGLVRIRQPITSPVTAMTTMPIDECIRLAILRPIRTADRLIGSERNLSMMPLSRSVVRPPATTKHVNTIVCPRMPGSRYSR
ncbi:hypothetical protein MTP03_31100 [Tsukamurella sp. PLM1]|nr:hypothetical protein MTP03_31100 [Tsukamurella sp. PLM1]